MLTAWAGKRVAKGHPGVMLLWAGMTATFCGINLAISNEIPNLNTLQQAIPLWGIYAQKTSTGL